MLMDFECFGGRDLNRKNIMFSNSHLSVQWMVMCKEQSYSLEG